MIRGRTTGDGAVEFYDNASDEVVFTIDADGAAGTGLMTGSATAVADSTATDAAGLVEDFNALLAALRSRGVISGA